MSIVGSVVSGSIQKSNYSIPTRRQHLFSAKYIHESIVAHVEAKRRERLVVKEGRHVG